jgi:hypothetical protein
LAATGPLAGEERREHAVGQVLRTQMIRDGDTDWTRVVGSAAGGADQSACRLAGQVGAAAVGIGATRAERAGRAHDHPRIARGQLFVADPPAFECPRHEVGDHHVGAVHHAQEDVLARFLAQVERHAALSPVAGDEVRRSQILHGNRNPARLVAEPR